jgi:hypothetical protein
MLGVKRQRREDLERSYNEWYEMLLLYYACCPILYYGREREREVGRV